MLKTEHFDFSTDERYNYDRKNAPRPSDLAAAQQLWRQQLRYEYLQEKLTAKKTRRSHRRSAARRASGADDAQADDERFSSRI